MGASGRVVLYVEDNPANIAFMNDVMNGFEGVTLLTAMTAAASDHDRSHGEQAGFDRYLTKPIKIDELLSALEATFAPPATP